MDERVFIKSVLIHKLQNLLRLGTTQTSVDSQEVILVAPPSYEEVSRDDPPSYEEIELTLCHGAFQNDGISRSVCVFCFSVKVWYDYKLLVES